MCSTRHIFNQSCRVYIMQVLHSKWYSMMTKVVWIQPFLQLYFFFSRATRIIVMMPIFVNTQKMNDINYVITIILKYAYTPKDSKIVLASSICCSTHVLTLLVTEHKYCKMNFVVSVFPAPLSPDITHDWSMSPVCKLL